MISQEIIYPSPLQVASNTKKTATETIGSRLRKRRRTDLSPSEDPPPASKRVQSSKKAPVSEIDRQGPVARGSVFQGTQEMATEADYDPPQISNQVSAVDGQHPSFGRLLPDNHGAPDFNAVIADIINHGETVDNQYAVRHYEDVPMPQAGNFPLSSASFKLKTQSLPVLENLVSLRRSPSYKALCIMMDIYRLLKFWKSWQSRRITRLLPSLPSLLRNRDKHMRLSSPYSIIPRRCIPVKSHS